MEIEFSKEGEGVDMDELEEVADGLEGECFIDGVGEKDWSGEGEVYLARVTLRSLLQVGPEPDVV